MVFCIHIVVVVEHIARNIGVEPLLLIVMPHIFYWKGGIFFGHLVVELEIHVPQFPSPLLLQVD